MKTILKFLYPVVVFLIVFMLTYVLFYRMAKKYQIVPKSEPKKTDLGLDYETEEDIEEIEMPSFDIDLKLVKAVDKLQQHQTPDIGPVNLEKFNYMLNPRGACDGFQKETNASCVLVLVKSAPDHARLRQWLRVLMNDTIGKYGKNLRLLFLLGFSKKNNRDIYQEGIKYGDIIQRDFIDTYRNLTFKTKMGYEWASSFCKSASFIVFQDDDFFINVKNVFDFLSRQYKPDDLFIGYLVPAGASVVRERASKWFVSNIVFSSDAFPPYFPGGSYFVSSRIAKRLTLAFPYVQDIPVDDVYLGLVASKLGIPLKHSSLFDFANCQNWNKCLACKAFI
ncbi:beta-1,3-galactosyltransferase brn-like [Saccostrea echinata]|uniref:beta-1,3-galactosyltransferase brn-like n=1 Tax=Saccostrea echinata TaxID=191078 RepID=UPI002A83551B|nr:beta-1,3-galactosyltransferase brn-like [Saccostrea echinata]